MHKIKMRLKRFAARFSFEDNHQQRAFTRLIKFFAVMLVLTLIARGTAGATVPVVEQAHPVNATLINSIKLNGTVTAAAGALFTAPEGLTVLKLNAEVGEAIANKQSLATFSEDEVTSAIRAKKAQLTKMQVQYKQLAKGVTADAYDVGEAQKALDAAYQGQKDAAASANAAIAAAADKRNVAQTALTALQAAVPPDPDAIAAATQTLNEATAQLEGAQQAAQSSAQQTAAAAQAAQNARDAALHSYTVQHEEALKTQETNSADAGVLAVQIEQQKDEIKQLEQIKANDYKLEAPQSGTLLEWKLTQGAPSTKIAGSFADENGAFTVSFVIAAEDVKKVTQGFAVKVTQGETTQEVAIATLSPPNAAGEVTAGARLTSGSWQSGACTLVLELSRKEYGLCLPNAAIRQDNSGTFVYVIETQNTVLGIQNVLARVVVTVEEQGETQTAVQGAITADSAIVSASTKLLSVGAKVRVAQ